MFNCWIDTITFSNGTTVQLEPSSVLLIIGPNSSGKSTALREIEGHLASPHNPQMVVQSVDVTTTGEQDDFREWLESKHSTIEQTDGNHVVTRGGMFPLRLLADAWKELRQHATLESAGPFLLHRLDTQSRLTSGDPVNASSGFMMMAHNYTYIHLLQLDDRLREAISAEVQKAFGMELFINWGGGANVWLHVGQEPERTREKDRVSSAYLQELNQVPRLEHQGDGVRSFVGTLLASFCGAHPLLLVDEPELFLSTPQARRLAGLLAKGAEQNNRQVIIATHSSDIVRGVLDACSKVTICRLSRQQDVTNVAVLNPTYTRDLWSKPLLRSATAIDGLFHDGVVVCEADTDCRFYESLLRTKLVSQHIASTQDLYFVHGGGKGALSTLANVYVQLEVPTTVIADFDLLRRGGEFKNVFIALGGDFASIERLYTSVTKSLNSLPAVKSVDQFTAELRQIVEDVQQHKQISTENRKALTQALDDSAAWSEAKKHGVNKLTGGAYQDCVDLLAACKAIGLFLVPTGELESWWRGGPRDKNDWCRQAVEQLASDSRLFRDAAEFMSEVCIYLSTQPNDQKEEQDIAE